MFAISFYLEIFSKSLLPFSCLRDVTMDKNEKKKKIRQREANPRHESIENEVPLSVQVPPPDFSILSWDIGLRYRWKKERPASKKVDIGVGLLVSTVRFCKPSSPLSLVYSNNYSLWLWENLLLPWYLEAKIFADIC